MSQSTYTGDHSIDDDDDDDDWKVVIVINDLS